MTAERVDSVDLLQFLSLCSEIERATGRLYLEFAQVHRAIPVVAALWKKSAAEEENHAGQIRLAMAGQAAMVSKARISTEAAKKTLASIEALIASTRLSPPSILQALQLAVALEESLSKFHVENAVIFSKTSHEKLFRAMMGADKGHIEELSKALAGYAK